MKKLLVFFAAFLILVCSSSFIHTYAKDYRFEKNFIEVGYKEVNKALEESEKHFNRNIVLPIQIPPIVFTHNLGRFSNLEGNANDYLEIIYLNKDIGGNHYIIEIRSIDYKIKINEEHVNQVLKLNDGSEAVFSTIMIQGFNTLVFEKKGFQYNLVIDTRVSDQVTLDSLMEIANSVIY